MKNNKPISLGICIFILVMLGLPIANALYTQHDSTSVGRIVGDSPHDLIHQLDANELNLNHATYLSRKRVDYHDDYNIIREKFPGANNIRGELDANGITTDKWYLENFASYAGQFSPNEFLIIEADGENPLSMRSPHGGDKLNDEDVNSWKSIFAQNYPFMILNSEFAGTNLPKRDSFINKLTRYSTIIAPEQLKSNIFVKTIVCNLGKYRTIGELYRNARNAYYENTPVGMENPGLVLQSFNLYGAPTTEITLPQDYSSYDQEALEEYCGNLISKGRDLSRSFQTTGFTQQTNDLPRITRSLNLIYSLENTYSNHTIISIDSFNNLEVDGSIVVPYKIENNYLPPDSIVFNVTHQFSNPTLINSDEVPSWYRGYVDRQCIDEQQDESFRFYFDNTGDSKDVRVEIFPLEIINCSSGEFRLYQTVDYEIGYFSLSPIVFDSVKALTKILPGENFNINVSFNYVNANTLDGEFELFKDDELIYQIELDSNIQDLSIPLTAKDSEGFTKYYLRYIDDDNNETLADYELEIETRTLEFWLELPDLIQGSANVDLKVFNHDSNPTTFTVNDNLILNITKEAGSENTFIAQPGLNTYPYSYTNLLKSNQQYQLKYDLAYDNKKETLHDLLVTNHRPVLDAIGDATIKEGDLLNLNLSATDLDGDSLSYTVTPPVNNNGIWQTSMGDKGNYSITVTVSDGYSQDSTEVLITVIAPNTPPDVLDILPITVNEEDIASVIIFASDEDGDNLTYSINGGNFTQVADNWFEWHTHIGNLGSHTFSCTVSDGVNSTVKNFNIEVLPLDLCRDVTCDDHCLGTARFENGICSAGVCNYTSIDLTSAICGYIPPTNTTNTTNSTNQTAPICVSAGLTCDDYCDAYTWHSGGACFETVTFRTNSTSDSYGSHGYPWIAVDIDIDGELEGFRLTGGQTTLGAITDVSQVRLVGYDPWGNYVYRNIYTEIPYIRSTPFLGGEAFTAMYSFNSVSTTAELSSFPIEPYSSNNQEVTDAQCHFSITEYNSTNCNYVPPGINYTCQNTVCTECAGTLSAAGKQITPQMPLALSYFNAEPYSTGADITLFVPPGAHSLNSTSITNVTPFNVYYWNIIADDVDDYTFRMEMHNDVVHCEKEYTIIYNLSYSDPCYNVTCPDRCLYHLYQANGTCDVGACRYDYYESNSQMCGWSATGFQMDQVQLEGNTTIADDFSYTQSFTPGPDADNLVAIGLDVDSTDIDFTLYNGAIPIAYETLHETSFAVPLEGKKYFEFSQPISITPGVMYKFTIESENNFEIGISETDIYTGGTFYSDFNTPDASKDMFFTTFYEPTIEVDQCDNIVCEAYCNGTTYYGDPICDYTVKFRTNATGSNYCEEGNAWIEIDANNDGVMELYTYYSFVGGYSPVNFFTITPEGYNSYYYDIEPKGIIINTHCGGSTWPNGGIPMYTLQMNSTSSIYPLEPYASNNQETYSENLSCHYGIVEENSPNCIAPDPCGGIICNDYCDGFIEYSSGSCNNGLCDYSIVEENSTSCGWVAPDPCEGIVCDDYCDSYTHYSNGACNNGECDYSNIEQNSLQCNYDPCTGIVCNDYCDGYTFHSGGSCSGGSCTYANSQQNSLQCNYDPCTGVACDDYCDGYTSYSDGSCSGGSCTYNTIDDESSICGFNPVCYTDSDCGQETWSDLFCVGDEIHGTLSVPICMDGGTMDSECAVASSIAPKLTCSHDCLNGRCTIFVQKYEPKLSAPIRIFKQPIIRP